MAVIGLDLGGTKLSGAVFNNDGEVLTKKVSLLGNSGGEEVGRLIQRVIRELSDTISEKKSLLTAIGISIPGISYTSKGTVWAPNINGWENYPLYKEVFSLFEDPSIRITIDSDRACSILGEVWKGAASGCKHAIFLAVGTGIGAGILINGKILRGADDIAGAIGWLALNKPYNAKYKEMGCFEYHASGDGLARVTKDYLNEDKNYDGILSHIEHNKISAHTVFQAFDQDDPIAKRVINQAIEYWGMAIANLVSLFNPEKIILGGGVFGPGLQFKQQIAEEATKWAQPISFRKISIEGSVLQSNAPLFGAAYLALKDLQS